MQLQRIGDYQLRALSLILALFIIALHVAVPFGVRAEGLSEDEVKQLNLGTRLYRGGSGCAPTGTISTGANGTLPNTVPDPWRSLIMNAAPKYPKVDPRLVATVLWVENRGWPEFKESGWSTSSASAQGPFQFIPSTWASLGTDGNGDGIKDPNNPYDSVEAAFKHHENSAGLPITRSPLTGNPETDQQTAVYEKGTLLQFLAKYNGSSRAWPAEGTKLSDFRNTENHNYIRMGFFLLDSNFTKGIMLPQNQIVDAAGSGVGADGSTQVTIPTVSGGTTTGCNGSAGGVGLVNTDGYSFPVAPQKKSENKAPSMSSLPCNNAGGCHHDGSPAFDLSRKPGGDAAVGTPVYAISAGVIKSVRDSYKGESGCNSFQLISSKDNFYYWHGHVQNVTVPDGQTVTAGQQIAVIGERRCTGNGSDPHLHIDRGCLRDGKPQPGGGDSCRDPGIVALINSLFTGLPE